MASKLSSFLTELKRRKVYRVATVLVVVGAGVIGLCEAALPPNVWQGFQIPVGIIIVGLGETEQALDWLDSAYDEHDLWMPFLSVDSLFDPLRSEPRFVALLEKVGVGGMKEPVDV